MIWLPALFLVENSQQVFSLFEEASQKQNLVSGRIASILMKRRRCLRKKKMKHPRPDIWKRPWNIMTQSGSLCVCVCVGGAQTTSVLGLSCVSQPSPQAHRSLPILPIYYRSSVTFSRGQNILHNTPAAIVWPLLMIMICLPGLLKKERKNIQHISPHTMKVDIPIVSWYMTAWSTSVKAIVLFFCWYDLLKRMYDCISL